MASTTFTNGVTLTEAAWFQDVNTVTYTLFGNGTTYTGNATFPGTLTAADNFGIAATKRLHLDGVSLAGNTYIQESSADVLDFIVGGITTFSMNGTYVRAAGGIQIVTASTNNGITNASTGAGSTTLYIGNASINVTSDERIKEGVRLWDGDATAILQSLPVKAWDRYTQDEPVGGYDGNYVGFTAQDLHKVAPWSVNTQGDTGLPWHARYELLNGIIVKAFQELRAEFQAYKASH